MNIPYTAFLYPSQIRRSKPEIRTQENRVSASIPPHFLYTASYTRTSRRTVSFFSFVLVLIVSGILRKTSHSHERTLYTTFLCLSRVNGDGVDN